MQGPVHGLKRKDARHAPPLRNLVLDITEQRALAVDASVKVALVPVDRQGKLSKAKVTFKGVSVVFGR